MEQSKGANLERAEILISSFSRGELLQLTAKLLAQFSLEERKQLLQEEEGFPVSIFAGKLSGLESAVVYLRENKQKSVKEIAQLLKRSTNTIYNTYTKARQKFSGELSVAAEILVPFTIFSDRKYSFLETLVVYLHNQGLALGKIAPLLNKSYNTVKTVSRRYKLKHGK